MTRRRSVTRRPLPAAGDRFGKRTVLGFADRAPEDCPRYVYAKCDCGVVDRVSISNLTSGQCQSCRKCRNTHHTHGKSKTPEYEAWEGMRKRCRAPGQKDAHLYRDKGITVCPRWEQSFEAFLADMGPKPSSSHSIDRYPDRDGNYEKDNCRWATPREQCLNTSRIRRIEYQGRTQSAIDWATELQIPYRRLMSRLNAGWTVSRAIETPAHETGWRYLEYNGERHNVTEWARRLGMTMDALRSRLRNGWTVEQAIQTPARQKRPVD